MAFNLFGFVFVHAKICKYMSLEFAKLFYCTDLWGLDFLKVFLYY